MSIVALICPQCGGEISIDNERDFGFCSYCGTKIVLNNDEVVINLSVSQENPVTKESLFERAEIFLADGNYSEAEEYYNKVLDIDPKFSKAYWGLLKSKKKASTDGDLVQKGESIKTLAEYNNAVKFGTSEEKVAYEKISDAIEAKIFEIEKLRDTLAWLKEKEKLFSFLVYLSIGIFIFGIIKWLGNSGAGTALWMIAGIIGAICFAFLKFKNGKEKEKTEKELDSKEK